jgi:hypothetical protein
MEQQKAAKRMLDFVIVGTPLVTIPIVTVIVRPSMLEVWPLHLSFEVIGITLLIAALRLKIKYKIPRKSKNR